MHHPSHDCPPPCAINTDAGWAAEREHKFYGPQSWQFTSYFQRYDSFRVSDGRRCIVKIGEPVS